MVMTGNAATTSISTSAISSRITGESADKNGAVELPRGMLSPSQDSEAFPQTDVKGGMSVPRATCSNALASVRRQQASFSNGYAAPMLREMPNVRRHGGLMNTMGAMTTSRLQRRQPDSNKGRPCVSVIESAEQLGIARKCELTHRDQQRRSGTSAYSVRRLSSARQFAKMQANPQNQQQSTASA